MDHCAVRFSIIGQLHPECTPDMKSRFWQIGNHTVSRAEVICPEPRRATRVPYVMDSLKRFGSKPKRILPRHRVNCGPKSLDAILNKDDPKGGSETSNQIGLFCGSPHVESLLDSVKWDDKGLAVTIAQNLDTGAILMQGFANREALATTISSRKATFYSRSRSSLWTKGETSMNFINVHDIFIDCDRDSIIYLGKPDGPTCHTGSETCYYSSVYDILEGPQLDEHRLASTTLYSLEATISQRKTEIVAEQNGKPSWTKRLLLDNDLLCSKIREEAGELVQTLLENEDRARTASEMADLLYHAMVLLKVKDVKIEEVLELLRKRFSKSGIEEKNNRKKPGSIS